MTTGNSRFIVLEGGDGAGKSTVLHALAQRLRDTGSDVIPTREPGGTTLGEQVRAIVAGRDALAEPLAELLLFEAARAQLVAQVIRPALERGAVVLCDRYAASSIAYQAYGRGLPRNAVERANAIATGGLAPALTLLLDAPVDIALARRGGGGATTHFDRETVAFHERVRNGFLALARESPAAWRIIDASRPAAAVIDDCWAAIAQVIAAD